MSDDVSLFDLFREEVRAQAAVLGEGLLALEADAGDARKIEPLMRAAHSVKGPPASSTSRQRSAWRTSWRTPWSRRSTAKSASRRPTWTCCCAAPT